MIISTLVAITLIMLLIEIRSKEFIYFVLIFPQSDKQRNGIFVIIFITAQGQVREKQERLLVKCLMWMGSWASASVSSTCLIRWIRQLAFLSQVHLTFYIQGDPSHWLIHLFITLLFKKKDPSNKLPRILFPLSFLLYWSSINVISGGCYYYCHS